MATCWFLQSQAVGPYFMVVVFGPMEPIYVVFSSVPKAWAMEAVLGDEAGFYC